MLGLRALFTRLSVRMKIAGIIAGMALTLGAINVFNLVVASDGRDAAMDQSRGLAHLAQVHALQDAVQDLRARQLGAVAAGRTPDGLADAKARVQEQLDALAATRPEAAKALRARVGDLNAAAERARKAGEPGSDAMREALGAVREHGAKAGERLGALVAEFRERVNADNALVLNHTGSTVTASIALLAAVVPIAAGAWLIMSATVLRPLVRVTGVMNELTQGKVDTDVPYDERRDEVGDLAKAIDVFKTNMVERQTLERKQAYERERRENRLHELESAVSTFQDTVNGIVENLGTAATDLHGNAETLTSTARETSSHTETVERSAEDASNNVQTVASAADDLTRSMRDIAGQVQHSHEIAEKAATRTRSTSETIDGLSKAADKISEVVTLINDIAEQTNLLALNATIEASRAGEAGKGFAVVAGEVKSLANQTAKATEDIRAQVDSIQTETKAAVSAIEEIISTIDEINQVAGTIADSARKQEETTENIARNVQEAASRTDDVATAIADVRGDTTRTTDAAQQVLTASTSLSRSSDTLRQEVAQFLEQVRSSSEADRRRHTRHEVAYPCLIYHGQTAHRTVMKNIAEGGAGLKLESGIPVEAWVKILVPGSTSKVMARVVRMGDDNVAGVEFDPPLSRETVDAIAERSHAA